MEISLGKQIAQYRKDLGLTQEALANKLGVTNQAVSKWETDQSCPDIQLLPKLADLFGVSIDALFGRETGPEQVPVIGDLPWADDNTLRAVLYIGRKLQHNKILGMRHMKTRAMVEFRYDGPAVDVESDFSVVCTGQVGGNVKAGDSVECGPVCGSVRAGDGVRCGNVAGNVSAGDSVHCGDVGGNVSAGDGVRCSAIHGEVVNAGDGVRIVKE